MINSIYYFLDKYIYMPIYKKRYIIKRFLWWFLYRFHPKHKYNIVNLGLKPNYYDQNTRMFYAIFRLFEDYIEEASRNIGGYDYVIGDDPDFDKYVNTKEKCDICIKSWYLDNRKVYEDFYQAWHWWLKIGKNFESYQEKLCYNKEKGTWDSVLEGELNLESDIMILKIVRHINSLWC